jgi:hypothetical protein
MSAEYIRSLGQTLKELIEVTGQLTDKVLLIDKRLTALEAKVLEVTVNE